MYAMERLIIEKFVSLVINTCFVYFGSEIFLVGLAFLPFHTAQLLHKSIAFFLIGKIVTLLSVWELTLLYILFRLAYKGRADLLAIISNMTDILQELANSF